ncbi:Helix-hairpin-helix motif-containing protein [Chitinophaga costaii]|uniref:Helix-hairpin-helix motif-containing protein n=1 Tax=Chitinophaga costaii TaxID=1335309 RepID=A0A1C4C0X0_9BACT|nr:helix-hairpin-helix domain-containing protein [Chitinophaga costaii]PUZ27384.1 helix-hairpin-helix domain-containing protein [Chitinophaga costaii]SCC12745.1 Helix-hairpin-helix motif-containing protein [Chitinophaga costaii]
MKTVLFLLAGIFACARVLAQQPETQPYITENQFEEESARTDAIPQEDGQWQDQEAYRRRPLQLNKASAGELASLGMLTPWQITALLRYRDTLGAFISLYELQAIPGFDQSTIERLLPFVQVGYDLDPHINWRTRLTQGSTSMLLRYTRTMEAARGYQAADSVAPHYLGSPDGLQLRYRYNHPGYASYGLVMQKDAGEQWFQGAEKQGFDFYSAHAAIKNDKALAALLLGDYTVNMGQGLVNWQAQAFGKSAGVMNVERQGDLLRPYASAGEYYFYRGAAITLRAGHWRCTAFASSRKLDGNAVTDTLGINYITSLVASGYHRSENELNQRQQVRQYTMGGNIGLHYRTWQWGLNVLYNHLSQPLQKRAYPYNRFEFAGQALGNASVDYSGNWRNLHFFGEVAASDNRRFSMIQGLLAAVAPAIDLALVYRHYDRAYQSLYANAFGESFRPANESGVYSALTWRLFKPLTLNAYFDAFRFPWLKYRVNAPSAGNDLQGSLLYALSKKSSVYMGYHHKTHDQNLAVAAQGLTPVWPAHTFGWRWQSIVACSPAFTWKMRVQTSTYRHGSEHAAGWMLYEEGSRQWKRFTLTGRITLFNTDNSDARIYINETSMLYSYDIAQLYGKGYTWYVQARYKTKHFTCWCRLRQAHYSDADHIGSGWDEIKGPNKTALQVQVEYRM